MVYNSFHLKSVSLVYLEYTEIRTNEDNLLTVNIVTKLSLSILV